MSISPARPASVAGTPLRELATLLGLPAPDTGTVVTGATLRAHEVLPGDVFAALPGARTHGARYADRAVEAGAVAVLTDPDGAALLAAAAADVPALVVADPRSALGPLAARIYGDPSTALTMIGVTGTSGKTTSCFLVEAALAAQGLTTGLIGTVMTRIAGPAGSQELPSAFTTPEAPDLQALLAVMRERGVQAVTMEVSSHALALGRVGGTRFRVGAFTNLSQDHLDFHPDMEDYFEAKAALFDGRSDAGVVVVDDEWGRRLAARHPDAVTVSAVLPADRADGADRASHWQLTALDTDATGRQRLRIAGPDGLQLDTGLALPGRYNVANAMTAIAAVAAAGFDPQRAADAVATVQVPGRMQRVDAGQDFLAVVDYAHKPAAVAAVLDAVRAAVPGRVVVVLGAGGDRDTGKRALMGAAAAARADTVIVTDDNPRSEDPAAIRAAVLAGAHGERRHRRAERIEEVGDRRAAIAAAVAQARPGDAVVIAGKGHEKGQQVGEVVHPFSDEQELHAALQRAGRQGVAR